MTRSYPIWSALAFCGMLSCFPCFAQSSAPSNSQGASPAPGASPATTPDSTAPAASDPKKTKKVWTNDDVSGLTGPISVVGDSKNLGKAGSGAKADPQYIANTHKELAKLRSQLDDADKQLADLKDFSEGKTPTTSSGYQINKGYNREPVDQQITGLQGKKKQLQDKIDALLDEARKKGVQPGDLR
jgi:hypothetical protein